MREAWECVGGPLDGQRYAHSSDVAQVRVPVRREDGRIDPVGAVYVREEGPAGPFWRWQEPPRQTPAP